MMKPTPEELIEFLQNLVDTIKNSDMEDIELTNVYLTRDHRQVQDEVEIDEAGNKWACWELTGSGIVKFTLFVKYNRREP